MLESWDAEEKPKAAPKSAPKSAPKGAATKVTVDLDSVDEKTRRELQRKAELDSDLNNAADLFGGLGLNDHPREKTARLAAEAKAKQPVITSDTPLTVHPLFQPESKADFEKLRKGLSAIMTTLATQSSMNYASSLAIDLTRDMAKPMSTENIRKLISTLNLVLKEKEREERQARLSKAGGTSTGGAGKKKAKGTKANLGGAFKKDSDVVVDNYDDFADDDFM